METKLHKEKLASRFGKVVKHFVKEAGVAEVVNCNVKWPLKIV